ncbi:hypothetical protein GCM10009430_34350 [Aquimarina litoralis]|uniref:Leucine-rich repeat domain-containing protein n=1 Tax=Aquimarina litoralis TaxID=584605 RepID=A0ABP3U8G6_9FLAO
MNHKTKHLGFAFLIVLFLAQCTILYGQKPITWVNKKNVTVKNKYISKFQGGLLWDAGATSNKVLALNSDGWMTAVLQKPKQSKIIGLTKVAKIANWETVTYGIRFKSGKAIIVEGDKVVLETGRKCKKGDIVKIEKVGTTISYKINDELLYTSKKDVSHNLRVKVTFFSTGVGFLNGKTKNFISRNATSAQNAPKKLEPGEVLMSSYMGGLGSTIGIKGINSTTLEAINAENNKEDKVIALSLEKLSQADFNIICEKLKWVKKVSIWRSEKSGVKKMTALKKLANLEEVYFFNGKPKLPKIDLAIFSKLAQLKKIAAIKFTRFDNYELLKNLPNLEILELNYADLESIEFLKDLSNLRELTISGYYDTFTDLEPVGYLKKLEKLNIRDNEKINNLDPLLKCTNLKEIEVSRFCPRNEIEKLKKTFPNIKGKIFGSSEKF